ncbi:hypothetical protein FZC83_05420 [Rossellomorea marisflavi]|uniref:Uncharacterized protein n=2 Tax=Rossellomorea marisflavi TaxID=189381 RepID=A0A5D4S032_9BACI|nr:hypothetical protein [Rossellomorea marisflavi]TYS57003.1 hypothetical protein FZC83_05420 [Rossellomorea marisflavi]
MYRPTVRYADVYRNYVNDVFHATNLDRNQILRLALFVAANSPEFNAILRQHGKHDVPLPRPKWRSNHTALWMEQDPVIKIEGEDVNAVDGGAEDNRPVVIAGGDTTGGATAATRPVTRPPGPLREGVIRSTGGISFTLN